MAGVERLFAMDTGPRWLGVGHSAERDAHEAGRAAARRSLRGDDPALLVVFASGVDDPTALLAGIERECPGTPLIGCCSELLVSADAQTHGVVVTALGGPGFAVRTAAGSCGEGAQRAGGAAVARGVADVRPVGPDDRQVLVLLTD